jgi:outer membrane autotransporter protein
MRDHYDQLGGRSRPSLAPIAVTGTTRFLGTISNRLRNPSAVIASGNGYGLPLAGASGPDGTVDSRISYDVDMGGYNFAVGNGSPYLSESRWGFWAKGYGLFGKRDHSIEAPGYEYRTYGVGVGLDYQFTETLLIGLTGGYADTYVNYRRSRDDSDLRAMHFGVYGSVDTGRTYLDSLLTYTDLDYDTERYVDLTSERLEGEFGGYAVSGYLETGFDWQRIEGWLVQPLASFQWSYLALESYRESGGDAALGFKRQSFESYIGSLGAKVSKDLLRDSPTKRLAVQFRARWLHEFGDTRADVNTYFASDPTVIFNIRNESIARDSAVLGVGLGAELNRNTRLYVDYDTRLNRDDTAHLISGGLQHRW